MTLLLANFNDLCASHCSVKYLVWVKEHTVEMGAHSAGIAFSPVGDVC